MVLEPPPKRRVYILLLDQHFDVSLSQVTKDLKAPNGSKFDW
jgi:hypothetical protein